LRILSESEALLVQDLLAGPRLDREPGRTVDALPRRTRQSVLQRIFLREWVKIRVVPHPVAANKPFVSFALARPFADTVRKSAIEWSSIPEAVVVWEAPDLIFGVFFSSSGESRSRSFRSLIASIKSPRELYIELDARKDIVPVYFDFEAAWRKIADLPGVVTYPHPLPGTSLPSRPRLTARQNSESALAQLVASPFLQAGGSGLHSEFRSLPSGSRSRTLLRKGYAEVRRFLDPTQICRWVTNFPRGIVFIYGHLQDGASPPRLFQKLIEEARISPFLYVTDNAHVLIGVLADEKHPPEPGAPDALKDYSRPGVLSILSSGLFSITIARESLSSLITRVDHRYDRLFDPDSWAGTDSPV
jgi:hypothetical protein